MDFGGDALRRRLEAALGERYELAEELNPGGMSRVFRARERALKRDVVIKVAPHDELHARAANRFKRETQLAAQLSHPNIVPVLAAGEIPDLLYYVMPYVEGESLRARLNREGPLAIDTVVALAVEIASALDYAHRRGVVHRDIKPENILLEDGHARVADFGLARGHDDPSITAVGGTVGTPAYMSPEQATGEREINGRSDIYSLGCVVYEMLAGEPPFTGHSSQTIIRKRFLGPPPSVRAIRDVVPPALDAVVQRSMALAQTYRFQSAADFASALKDALHQPAASSPAPPARPRWSRARRIGIASVLALLVLATAGYAMVPAERRTQMMDVMRRGGPSLSRDRIVVAPLENRTGDPGLDLLGDMAADWISQGLLQLDEFEVVDGRTARRTALVVEDIPLLLRTNNRAIALAEEVGAGILLSGTYDRSGDSIRIGVRATDVRSRRMLRFMAPVTVPLAASASFMPLVAQRASGLVAIATDTTPASTVRTSVPPSYRTYRALTSAWDRFVIARDTAALFSATRQAQEIDAAYLAPLLYESFGRAYYLQWPLVDSLLRLIEPRYGELTRSEARAFDYLKTQLAADNEAQLQAARALLAVLPGSPEGIVALVFSAWDVNRPHEALNVLAGVPPDRGVFLAVNIHWQYKAYSQHLVGDYSGQNRTALEGRRRFPDFYATSNDRVRALAALGRVRDLERHLSERVYRGDSTEIKRIWRATEAARELRAHGHDAAAAAKFAQLAEDPFVLSDTGRSGAQRRADAFYDAGRWADAERVLLDIAAASPDDVAIRGHLGAVAARLGRAEAAADADAWLAARDNRYLHGRHTYWRARIAAARGDYDGATRLLERAFAQGYPMNRQTGNLEVHLTADFAPLRTFGPYVQLMRPRR